MTLPAVEPIQTTTWDETPKAKQKPVKPAKTPKAQTVERDYLDVGKDLAAVKRRQLKLREELKAADDEVAGLVKELKDLAGEAGKS